MSARTPRPGSRADRGPASPSSAAAPSRSRRTCRPTSSTASASPASGAGPRTTTATVRERFPFVGRVYASAEELLADPEVRFVDIATGPEGRLDWIEAAVEAGKHVLAQKPLTLSARGPRPAAGAARPGRGRRRPGRGQPQRALGAAVAGRDPAGPGRARSARSSASPTCTTSRCRRWPARRSTTCRTCCSPTTSCTGSTSPATWLDRRRRRTTVTSVQAVDSRVPGPARRGAQPVVGHGLDGDGRRRHRDAADRRRRVTSEPGCPFWVHGTTGHPARQRAARLRPARARRRHDAHPGANCRGAWFVDGFAATMGELMCAVAEDREPENSAADAARSVAAGPRGPGLRRAGRHARRRS